MQSQTQVPLIRAHAASMRSQALRSGLFALVLLGALVWQVSKLLDQPFRGGTYTLGSVQAVGFAREDALALARGLRADATLVDLSNVSWDEASRFVGFAALWQERSRWRLPVGVNDLHLEAFVTLPHDWPGEGEQAREDQRVIAAAALRSLRESRPSFLRQQGVYLRNGVVVPSSMDPPPRAAASLRWGPTESHQVFQTSPADVKDVPGGFVRTPATGLVNRRLRFRPLVTLAWLAPLTLVLLARLGHRCWGSARGARRLARNACPRCAYPLSPVTRPVCSECGWRVESEPSGETTPVMS